jgi:hypothetical protein
LSESRTPPDHDSYPDHDPIWQELKKKKKGKKKVEELGTRRVTAEVRKLTLAVTYHCRSSNANS